MYKSRKFIVVIISFFILIYTNVIYANIIYSYNYTSINNETINKNKIWTGFKNFHNGFVHPPDAYKDIDCVSEYEYRYIPEIGALPLVKKDKVAKKAIGYGAYAMDYKKHIVGLLHYISRNIGGNDYPTEFVIRIAADPLSEIEEIPLDMSVACNIVASAITLNMYNKKYKDEVFKDFWKKCFSIDETEEGKKRNKTLLDLENAFYYKAYGESAVNYINENFYDINSLTSIAPAIKGAVFSLTEARYRNKNLGGKYNLQLRTEAGEVLPFLIYIKCDYKDINDNKRVYDNIKFEIIKRVEKDGVLEKIDYTDSDTINMDQIIDGAYQYMVYYYGRVANGERFSTVMNSLSSNDEDVDDDIDIDYIEEYEELTGRSFPYLHGKELEAFLNKVDEKRAIFKKSKDNIYGTFGEDEEYNIESDVNFSKAIENMEDAMIKTIGKDAFSGMRGEKNIARTYLMSKNIIDSVGARSELSYYDVGTNVIMKTPGENGYVYLLSDFQKVELDDKLSRDSAVDTDSDGIYDNNELRGLKEIDITEFVRHTLYADLYGKDSDDIKKEQKALQDYSIDIILSQYKQNVKSNFVTARSNNEYEYEFRYDASDDKLKVTTYLYESNPVLKDTDFDGIDDGYGYTLFGNIETPVNPKEWKDKNPLDNSFNGVLNSSRISGNKGISVDMVMDYRYFLMDNKMYYDELSTMSLLYSNSIYMKGDKEKYHSGLVIEDEQNITDSGDIMNIKGKKYKNLRVKDMMEFFGFQNVKVYYMGSRDDQGYDKIDNEQPICRNYKDTHKGSVAIGYKNIEYHGIEKSVIGIVIRGTAEDDDWDNDFDMGDKDLRDALNYQGGIENYKDDYDGILSELEQGILDYEKQYAQELLHFAGGYSDWTHTYHHAGFDIVSNRILEIVREYMDKEAEDMFDDYCFWVTGHSMGGGVANIVSAELLHSWNGINSRTDNVYCYTFAAPNTFYLTDNKYERDNRGIEGKKITGNYREPHGVKYRCIFNIVNDDDFVPEVPMKDCNWTKYGRCA